MSVKQIIDRSAVILASALVIVVCYGIWADMLDGKLINPVLEFGTRSKEYTHRTTKCVYHPGEMVQAEVMFHKNRNLVAEIRWNLINDRLQSYPVRSGSLPVGIWDKVLDIERIPLDALPGEHWFCGTTVYRPNWIGKVEYPIWTNKFMVER